MLLRDLFRPRAALAGLPPRALLAGHPPRALLARRTALSALLAGTACRALAQPAAAPRVMGPPVWLDLDQKALDDAYDQSVYAPNAAQIVRRYSSNSQSALTRVGPPVVAAYGPGAIERLEIQRTHTPRAPIFVFVHGGAWRGGRAADYAFPAEMFVAAGAHYVALDFAAVQDVAGNLQVMADQVRRAILWVHQNAASFGGDPDRLFLGGHSSGAHLAAVALTTDWPGQFGAPADIIKGGLCISGMYDMKPVRLSARANYVAFTDEIEHALSPQRHLDQLSTPLIIAHGSEETPEFQRQNREFFEVVQRAGKPARFLLGANYNHFEMMETLANPYGLTGRAVLSQMQLS